MIDNRIPLCVCIHWKAISDPTKTRNCADRKEISIVLEWSKVCLHEPQELLSTEEASIRSQKHAKPASYLPVAVPPPPNNACGVTATWQENPVQSSQVKSSPVLSCLVWLGKGSTLFMSAQLGKQTVSSALSLSPLLGHNKICLHQMRSVCIVYISQNFFFL